MSNVWKPRLSLPRIRHLVKSNKSNNVSDHHFYSGILVFAHEEKVLMFLPDIIKIYNDCSGKIFSEEIFDCGDIWKLVSLIQNKLGHNTATSWICCEMGYLWISAKFIFMFKTFPKIVCASVASFERNLQICKVFLGHQRVKRNKSVYAVHWTWICKRSILRELLTNLQGLSL